MIHHERRLPHWDVVGQPLFVTFRLHGSLPDGRAFPPALLTNGKAFAAMDRFLDRADTGPRYLAVPEIAELVVACLLDGDRRFHRYQLHSFVVMPNHVHMLVTPHVVSAKWLGPLKGFTAYRANRILARTGTPFWQEESYDHVVRSGAGLERVRRYIENNPVKAGLVTIAEDFRWSSAGGNGRAA
jgi:REP element-mobilizing transposase RayT